MTNDTMSLIEPRVLKGFRDYPPALMIPRERLLETARRVYRSYGFVPIDTPALEYTEILLGKGGAESDKQLYRFTDHGGRDVALRFDLTVPFARFAAEHNVQRGRYRSGPGHQRSSGRPGPGAFHDSHQQSAGFERPLGGPGTCRPDQ